MTRNHPLDVNTTEMVVLDGDGGPLKRGPYVAARDCVQFVPMRDYLGKDPAYLSSVGA